MPDFNIFAPFPLSIPNTLQIQIRGCLPPNGQDWHPVPFTWTGSGWQSAANPGGASFFLRWNGDGSIDCIPSLPRPCATSSPWPMKVYYGEDLTDPYNPVYYLAGLWVGITVNTQCCGIDAGGTLGIELSYGDMPHFSAPVSKCDCDCGKGCDAGGSGGGYKSFGVPGSASEVSDGPIRYSTGELVLSVDDLASGGYGAPWGHTRSFSSQLGYNEDFGQGFNWQVAQWPSLKQTSDNSAVLVMGQAGRQLWFDKSSSGFTPRLGLSYRVQSLWCA